MKKTHLLTLAAALSMGAAFPASAAFDHIGSVIMGPDDTTRVYRDFGGRVEGLALTAHNSDVVCRDVTATFGNGVMRTVFSGTLRLGREMIVDLPGQNRMVTRLEFDCHAAGFGAELDVAADVGRFRDDWRRSPQWDTVWSRRFNWENDRVAGVPPDDRVVAVPPDDRVVVVTPEDRYASDTLESSGWIPIARRSFEGPYDREVTVAGMRGRDVMTIGLRPLNDDARCSSVTATFRNGSTRLLDINGGDMLRENVITMLDLPGVERDVVRVDMNCHAVHNNAVTIQLLAAA